MVHFSNAFWIWLVLLGVTAEHGTDDLTVFKVVDIDFENTKILKPCLIAQLNATVEIYHTIGDDKTEYHFPIPQHASTMGSSCNMDYTSVLKLHFKEGSLLMTFFREGRPLSKPRKTTYCDLCDYGTWNMTHLKTTVELEEVFRIQASIDPKKLYQYAPELSEGVDIKRAFKCGQEDRLTEIPLLINEVINVTSHDKISSEYWSGKVVIYLIQVQPFLVLNPDHFNDPYFCRSITASLLLIILLPLIYFTIFIMFYRIKSDYGCPPNCSGPQREKLKSSSDSMEDESTNIMSGIGGSFAADFNSTEVTNTYC